MPHRVYKIINSTAEGYTHEHNKGATKTLRVYKICRFHAGACVKLF